MLAKPAPPNSHADPARAPGEHEHPVGVDQRRDRGERDRDRDEGVRHVELVVAEIEPVVFLLEPLGLGRVSRERSWYFLMSASYSAACLAGERLVDVPIVSSRRSVDSPFSSTCSLMRAAWYSVQASTDSPGLLHGLVDVVVLDLASPP